MSQLHTTVEQLLTRVISYLEGMDMVITLPLSARALTLVQDALLQQDEEPFRYVMTRLPDQFALPQLTLPSLAPPIIRGSIGYQK